VRFNDFLFAAHGAAMCVIIYSQFFPRIWGFKVGRTQSVSRVVLAIFWGLVLGVVVVAFMAMWLGNDGGYDASGWAWIDVVSTCLFFSRTKPAPWTQGVRNVRNCCDAVALWFYDQQRRFRGCQSMVVY
jgi:hypothetical protein